MRGISAKRPFTFALWTVLWSLIVGVSVSVGVGSSGAQAATPAIAVTGLTDRVEAGEAETFTVSLEGFTATDTVSGVVVDRVFQVSLSVSDDNGTLALSTDVGIVESAPLKRTGEPSIRFTGKLADLNAAMTNMTYTPSSAGNVTLSVSASQVPEVVADDTYTSRVPVRFDDNGHYYQYVSTKSGNVSWTVAKAAAEARSLLGQPGYLATLTSAGENNFVANQIDADDVWIGATDDFNHIFTTGTTKKYANQTASEGRWHWATGPESGTQFMDANGGAGFLDAAGVVSAGAVEGDNPRNCVRNGNRHSGIATAGQFSSWACGEPNNSSTSEHYAVTNWSTSRGLWNDLPDSATGVTGFLVEFSGFSAPQSAQTTAATTVFVKTKPAAPVISQITAGNQSLTVAYSISDDGGATVETVEYSLNGGSFQAFATTTSPATITGLTNGTLYDIVIRATNSVGASDSSSSVSGTPIQPASSPAPKPKPPVVDPSLTQNTTTNGTSQVLPPGRAPTPSAPPAPLSGPLAGVNGGNSQPPSAPTALIGGRQVPVNSQVVGGNQLNMQTGNTTFGVGVQQGQGSVSSGPGGSSELRVPAGGSTQLSGSGLFPGSTVQVFMPLGQNGSREVSQLTVNSNGSFSGDAVFTTRPTDPPLPIGRNVLQIASLNDAGERVVVEMAINIAQPPPAPQALRDDGTIPALTPGQSLATQAGVPIDVSLTVNSNTGNALVEGDGWALSMTLGDGNDVSETADGGAVLTMVRGAEASVSGSGFMPLTRADIWLFSDPTLLGSVEIDENGEFNGVVSIDGRVVPVGEHTLQLQGVGVDGFILAANLGVVVTDADDRAVPATSEASASMLWWVIAVLVLIAILAVVWWRIGARRREV